MLPFEITSSTQLILNLIVSLVFVHALEIQKYLFFQQELINFLYYITIFY